MSKVHFENYEQWNEPRQQQQQPGWLARWLGGWVSQPSVSRDSGPSPSGASSTVDDADSEEMLTEHLSHMVSISSVRTKVTTLSPDIRRPIIKSVVNFSVL